MNKNKYINYIHQKFLYTDDNWKTVLISKDDSIPYDCILEKNSKKAFEAKIKYEYGLKVGAFIIRELKKITKIRESITGEKTITMVMVMSLRSFPCVFFIILRPKMS